MRSRLFIFFILAFFIQQLSAKIFINEFMAANKNVLADESGEFDDWIEIYNDSTASVELSGYFLTDNLLLPQKWAFPCNCHIPAKGYLIIWADDAKSSSTCHTNFKLDASGEQIGLFNGFQFIDSLFFGPQREDVAYGRFPDGAAVWQFLPTSTPGKMNQNAPRVAESPVFSHFGGFYQQKITVTLRVSSPTAQIFYTLDSSEPSPASLRYSAPISINKTTVIRARTYETGLPPDRIITHTYIFYNLQLPIISLVTAPPNLWDSKTGIYNNPEKRGDDWERPVSVEYFTGSGASPLKIDAGLRIHGVNSRLYNKKPFRLYFRDEYGTNRWQFPYFNSKPAIDEFKRLVLLSGASDMMEFPGGYEWTLVRTAIGHRIFQKMGGNFLANRAVAVFLNGNVWGIYQLIERIDKFYIESNFNESDVDLVETFWHNWYVQEGDMLEWNRLYRFIEENDLADNSNYQMIQQMMDIDNFTDYQIMEIYMANADWPHNNIYAFRPRREDGKWRWILWDIDRSLGFIGPRNNTLTIATKADKNTILLHKLLENPVYRQQFILRFSDQINTNFKKEVVKSIMDSMTNIIRKDITFETNKWGSSASVWENNLRGKLTQFLDLRPGFLWRHLKSEFALDSLMNITFDIPHDGVGQVRINTIKNSRFPWTGSYFNAMPLEIEAIPAVGYQFAGWYPEDLAQKAKISITLNSDMQIYPIFKKYVPQPVVINEINYHSASDFNVGDWVELFNFADQPIDISGWHFRDGDDAHNFRIPENTIIDAGGFLVLAQDSGLFRQQFPYVRPLIGNFNFGLDNSGERVALYDPYLNSVDSVTYDDEIPWPLEPDGAGATLALKNPFKDNLDAKNWEASAEHGTPGLPNMQRSLPIIQVETNTIAFSGTAGRANPSPRVLVVQNYGAGELNWTANRKPELSWLLVSPDAGKAGDSLQITVEIAGLDAGTYSGLIILADSDPAVDSVAISVQLTLKPFLPPTILAEFEAENGANLPGSGWKVLENNGATGVLALVNSLNEFQTTYQLDYKFEVPAGENTVYVFAEVDVNNNQGDDSFWISMNSQETCLWRDLISLGDGWKRSWIFNYKKNSKHPFKVNPGVNILNVFPREDGAFINWLVVTTNPDLDIQNYKLRMYIDKAELVQNQNDFQNIPKQYTLNQNFPNPFNPEAVITFELPEDGEVSITIYNAIGQNVRTLINQRMSAGHHTIAWDGMDSNGHDVQSGIYFCQMRAAEFRQVIKMVRIR